MTSTLSLLSAIALPRLAAAFLLALLTPASALALEEWGSLDLFQPHISISAGGAPNSPLADGSGDYGASFVGGSLAFPIPGSPSADSAFPRLQFLGHLDAALAAAEIGFLGGSRSLTSFRAGLSARYARSAKDQFRASIGVGISEDETTMQAPAYRVSGLALGTHRTSPELSFSYGLSYSYLLGQGPLLPTFGIDWEPHPRWEVRALFPFTARVRYRASKRVTVGVRVGPDGNRYRVANDDSFPGQAETLRLRVSGLKAGLEGLFHLHGGANLRVEGGIAAAHTFTVSDGDTELLSTRSDAAPYVLVTLGFPLGSQARSRFETGR